MSITPDLQNNALGGQQAFNLDLQRKAMISINDAANVRIACVQGSVWITLDNDLRDIVLDDCGVFTTGEHRRALIYAMKPSRVSISTARSSVRDSLRYRQTKPLMLQMRLA